MIVSPSELPYSEFYNLLISSVVPRPIAWVSTVNAAGQPNLAPFSFFNARQPDAVHGEAKDTLRNVRETKEFVVNVVTYGLAEAMNLTSGEYNASVNEFELTKLTPQSSKSVRAPRIAESPVSFECKLHQIVDFSSAPTGSSLVIGKIVSIYIDDAHLKEGKLDRDSLDLVGRMGGIQYTRTTERFEMVRPKVG
jgi:flavin reductase (DIM6/NTAB) family NADH-FMN oxidoreductase RutF